MEQWFVDLVEEIQSSSDLTEIKSILIKLCDQLEFENVAYAVKLPDTFTRISTLVISNYSEEWLRRYVEQGYFSIDPVAQHCFSSQQPYLWTRFTQANEKDLRQFAGEASEFNLNDGISIGMPRFNGETGLISLATEKKIVMTPASIKRVILYLNAMQPYIHEKIAQLSNVSGKKNIKVVLTEREKTCLVWVAEGKTAAEIATILSVSEATVVFHIKNAIQKLNVTNRSQAIAKAVLLGLIAPQFPKKAVPTYLF